MGLNSEDVAKRADISYSTYNNIETGKSKPNLVTALKIAKVLNVTIEILFKLSDRE